MYGILGITMPVLKGNANIVFSALQTGSLNLYGMAQQMNQLNLVRMYAAGDMLYGVLKFIYFVFMFAVILGITYVTTKYIAKKGATKGNNRNLKIVETLGLGIDKSLMLVKVGEQYFLMSNSAKSLTLLTALDADKLVLADKAVLQENNELFGSVNQNVDEYLNSLDNSAPEVNDYLGTVKQSLSKLKSIVRGRKADE